MKTLSLVVPAYNEERSVEPFLKAIDELGLRQSIEIIFVDDGSVDGTFEVIKRVAQTDSRVRYLSFSRNFGKEAALYAGLAASTGDLVATMDIDLQHDPKLLPEMIAAVENEGYDSAAACRTTRTGEPILRSAFAHCFYAIMNRWSDVALKDGSMDYRLMTRQVVETVLSLKESHRFTKGIYEWVGFRTKWIACANLPRATGRSKWSFFSLVSYSVSGFLAFSTAPLKLVSVLGFLTTSAAFAYLFWVFGKFLIYGEAVRGWPTLVCITLILGGLQLFVMGIIALYLANIFHETKSRPLYVIKEAK